MFKNNSYFFPSSFSILSFHQVSVFDMPAFGISVQPKDQTLGPLGLASGSSGWSASVSNLEGSGLGVGETPRIAGKSYVPNQRGKGDFFWKPIHFQVSMLDFWGCLGIKHSSSTTTPTSATGIRCWICCKKVYTKSLLCHKWRRIWLLHHGHFDKRWLFFGVTCTLDSYQSIKSLQPQKWADSVPQLTPFRMWINAYE